MRKALLALVPLFAVTTVHASSSMTCAHAKIINFQAIEVTAEVPYVPGQSYVGTYAINGKYAFTAAAGGQFYTPAAKDGLNTVTDSVNGVVVASCSIKIKGLIYP